MFSIRSPFWVGGQIVFWRKVTRDSSFQNCRGKMYCFQKIETQRYFPQRLCWTTQNRDDISTIGIIERLEYPLAPDTMNQGAFASAKAEPTRHRAPVLDAERKI